MREHLVLVLVLVLAENVVPTVELHMREAA
jgi:hypothetical protein